MKKFVLSADKIKPIATGRGSCLASDRITIDGQPVGFMYREPPDDDTDSGWRFLAGDETVEYSNDPQHFELFDVNTIANYDPRIVKILDAPVYSAFEWSPQSEALTSAPFPGN